MFTVPPRNADEPKKTPIQQMLAESDVATSGNWHRTLKAYEAKENDDACIAITKILADVASRKEKYNESLASAYKVVQTALLAQTQSESEYFIEIPTPHWTSYSRKPSHKDWHAEHQFLSLMVNELTAQLRHEGYVVEETLPHLSFESMYESSGFYVGGNLVVRYFTSPFASKD